MLFENTVLLSLGSNKEDRLRYIETAVKKISKISSIKLVEQSKVINTKAVEYIKQADFLNQIVKIKTSMQPLDLLKSLQKIENDLGRIRLIPKGPRTIDIDILSYNHLKMDTVKLKLPHPGIYSRKFLQGLLISMNIDYLEL